MREVSLKNQRIIKILSGITDVTYEKETLDKLCKDSRELKDKLITNEHGASDAYLKRAKKYPVKDFGFPRCSLGIGTGVYETRDSEFFHQKIAKKVLRLQKTLGAQNNALIMLYPENGYIGWHHNGNASGYNILFSYSMDGDGYFSYYDKDKDEIIKMQDKPGWNVKCGYYPCQRNDHDRVYWHAAYTNSPRLSIAYIINNRELWSNMIEYISEGDFDREFVQGQGPLKDLKNNGYI